MANTSNNFQQTVLSQLRDLNKRVDKTTNKRSGGRSTAVGSSLRDITNELQKKFPLSRDEAKEEAKNIMKKQETLQHGGSGTGHMMKYQFLKSMFGKSISDQIVQTTNKKKIEGAEDYIDKHLGPQESSGSSGGDSEKLEKILSKLTTMEKDIATLKTVRVSGNNPYVRSQRPVMAPSTNTPPKMSTKTDAYKALKNLGYTKEEITEKLQGAPTNASTEEIVRYALKPEAERIPKQEVPTAVASAISSTSQETPIASPMNAKTYDAPTPIASPMNAKTYDAPTPIEKPVEKVIGTGNQEEAKQIAKGERETESKKKTEKEQQDILNQLKAIQKKLDKVNKNGGGKGLFDYFIGGLGKTLTGQILALLSRGVAALFSGLGLQVMGIVGTAVAAYAAGTWLNNKLHISEHLVDGTDMLKGTDKKLAADYDKEKENLVAKHNEEIKGTGYTAVDLGKYKDAKGNLVKAADLPPEIKTKLHMASAATKLEKANQQKTPTPEKPETTQDQKPNVVVIPTKEKVIQQKSSGSDVVLVSVRNSEPSQARYIADIFNHPATYAGMSRV